MGLWEPGKPAANTALAPFLSLVNWAGLGWGNTGAVCIELAGMTLRVKCSSRPLPRPQRGSTFPLALTLVLTVRAMGTGSTPALRPPLDSRKLFSASLEVCGLPVGWSPSPLPLQMTEVAKMLNPCPSEQSLLSLLQAWGLPKGNLYGFEKKIALRAGFCLHFRDLWGVGAKNLSWKKVTGSPGAAEVLLYRRSYNLPHQGAEVH